MKWEIPEALEFIMIPFLITVGLFMLGGLCYGAYLLAYALMGPVATAWAIGFCVVWAVCMFFWWVWEYA